MKIILKLCFLGRNNMLKYIPHMLKHEWMEAGFAVLIFVYTWRKKAWINFLKILDFTSLFNYGKKQSTLSRLLKPGKEKGAQGMSTP